MYLVVGEATGSAYEEVERRKEQRQRCLLNDSG